MEIKNFDELSSLEIDTLRELKAFDRSYNIG